MTTSLRNNPMICLIISLFQLAIGKLRLCNLYLDKTISMNEKSQFRIFRHITIKNVGNNAAGAIFIVSFKFSCLSHAANKKASIIPMLLIAGFPGFVQKIYAVNLHNGYWQGMYQWKSLEHLKAYKKSFVFRIMNKRALPESIESFDIDNENLSNFMKNYIL